MIWIKHNGGKCSILNAEHVEILVRLNSYGSREKAIEIDNHAPADSYVWDLNPEHEAFIQEYCILACDNADYVDITNQGIQPVDCGVKVAINYRAATNADELTPLMAAEKFRWTQTGVPSDIMRWRINVKSDAITPWIVHSANKVPILRPTIADVKVEVEFWDETHDNEIGLVTDFQWHNHKHMPNCIKRFRVLDAGGEELVFCNGGQRPVDDKTVIEVCLEMDEGRWTRNVAPAGEYNFQIEVPNDYNIAAWRFVAARQSKSEADGFIKWEGGNCPCPGWVIMAKFRDNPDKELGPFLAGHGNELNGFSAESCMWKNEDNRLDIVAYKPLFNPAEDFTALAVQLGSASGKTIPDDVLRVVIEKLQSHASMYERATKLGETDDD
jgi:hypothetical protein